MRLPSCTSSDQNTSRPRILIADDHAIFVDALRAYLEKTYAVIGAVADGRAMLQEARMGTMADRRDDVIFRLRTRGETKGVLSAMA